MAMEGRVVQGEIKSEGQSQIQPNDIIFDCPQCGKSLAIDVRGAGYIVRCPECQAEIQVPGFEEPVAGQPSNSEEFIGVQNNEPPAGIDSPDMLLAEIKRLKNLHSLELERKSRISAELALIQAAIDRIVELLEEPPQPGSS
jgi:predicted RNA-binding Zn-ribbon protein involved in translation (DUF1610 family)